MRSRRGVIIFPGSIWWFNRVAKLSRLGAPTIGGTTTTQLPRLTCASWMVARSFASRRSAYHLTASRVIRADGSKRIGNQRTNSSRRALLATRREQQVRRPGNELIGDISDGAGSYRPAPLNFHPFLAAVTIASRQFPVLWKTACIYRAAATWFEHWHQAAVGELRLRVEPPRSGVRVRRPGIGAELCPRCGCREVARVAPHLPFAIPAGIGSIWWKAVLG